mmetsp:Transcript_9529/g.24207  ORF Transcript_9529/g.24207 Transcript_9529/m.24207 type:complete len:105 (-) Transcript_9529:425-739(-)
MERLAEHDIEDQDIQDRIDMLQHRQQILVKMTGRMLNSIESLMTTVHDVDDSYDMESKMSQDGILVVAPNEEKKPEAQQKENKKKAPKVGEMYRQITICFTNQQ